MIGMFFAAGSAPNLPLGSVAGVLLEAWASCLPCKFHFHPSASRSRPCTPRMPWLASLPPASPAAQPGGQATATAVVRRHRRPGRKRARAPCLGGRVRRRLHRPPRWQRPAALLCRALPILVASCLSSSVAGGAAPRRAPCALQSLAVQALRAHLAGWYRICLLLRVDRSEGTTDSQRLGEQEHPALWSTGGKLCRQNLASWPTDVRGLALRPMRRPLGARARSGARQRCQRCDVPLGSSLCPNQES